jgi:DHA2 family multidrug resistance protein
MISAKDISPATRALITVAVMSATLMQVLDTTIVNVALPHMEGSLSSTSDQITWILTSYLVASAIFMPLTGYFTDRLGRKNYLLISILGFVIASALCGAAVNITQIVVFRLLQGVFGAALVPLSQAIMADVYPEEDRGTAMAIWGMGVMVGPILGPTLGGYLTEIASWRWTFYINVPVGILSLILAWRVVPDTPKKERQMDWFGLFLISLSIGATQYFLDRGNQDDWFSSGGIRTAAFLAMMGLLGFLLHSSYQKEKSVFDVSIFNDRNFTLASLILALFGLGLYGAMVILPLMLEGLFNYPVLTTGLVMAPRGISGLVSMMFVGKLIKTMDPRLIIVLGIAISGSGMLLGTYYNLNISPGWIIGPLILQGFGLGMIFVPLSAIAFSTLPAHLRSEAAGLFSLLRTIGSSVGISVVATILSRHTQIAWNQLGGFINPYNPALTGYLQSIHMNMQEPLAILILGKQLATQAQMISFVDVYAFISWSFAAMLPLVLLLKKSKKISAPVELVE